MHEMRFYGSHSQRHLGCVVRVTASEQGPSHLDLVLEVALEAAVQDLPLTGFETVHHGWNRTLQICPGEQDQLLQHQSLSGALSQTCSKTQVHTRSKHKMSACTNIFCQQPFLRHNLRLVQICPPAKLGSLTTKGQLLTARHASRSALAKKMSSCTNPGLERGLSIRICEAKSGKT